MINFIVHDSAGRILRTGRAPDDQWRQQAGAGEFVIVGTAADDKDYVVNGEVILMPPKPSNHHVFDYAVKQWRDPRTLVDLKVAKDLQINAARLAANRTSFTYGGKQIAVDALSRSDIDAVHGKVTFSGALPDYWGGAWKTLDNSYVAIPDVATWGLFYGAMVNQGTANFNHAQALKAQLAAAQTPEAVAAIVW